MAWYLCESCGARIEADERPPACTSCDAGKMALAEQLRGRKTSPELELKPIEGEKSAQASAGKKDKPAALEAVGTVELDEGDLIGKAGAAPAAPPPVPILLEDRTVELSERDLEVPPATPALPALSPRPSDPIEPTATLELADIEIVEVKPAVPPPPPPPQPNVAKDFPPGFEPVAAKKSPLPAEPVAAKKSPPPAEPVAAKESPPPDEALPGQTERLSTRKSRGQKRKKKGTPSRSRRRS